MSWQAPTRNKSSHHHHSSKEGSLEITLKLLNAKGVKIGDVGGKSDPYVKVFKLTPKEERIYKTKVIYNTLDPVWDELCTFRADKDDNIRLEVWDKDVGPTDDFLGQVFFKIGDWGEHTLNLAPRPSLKDKGIIGSITWTIYCNADQDKDKDVVTDKLALLKNLQKKTTEYVGLKSSKQDTTKLLGEELLQMTDTAMTEVSEQDEHMKLFISSTRNLVKATTALNTAKDKKEKEQPLLEARTRALKQWETAAETVRYYQEKQNEEVNMSAMRVETEDHEENWKERALSAEARVQQLEGKIESLIRELDILERREKRLSQVVNQDFIEEPELGMLKTRYSSTKALSQAHRYSYAYDVLSPEVTLKEIGEIKNNVSNPDLNVAELNKWELPHFVDWLRKNGLDEYISVYVAGQEGPGEKTKMFIPRKAGLKELELEKAPLEFLLELLLTVKDSKLLVIFDYFLFLEDFVLVFRHFSSRRKLLNFLKERFKSGDDRVKEQVLFVMQQWVEFGYGENFRDRKLLEEWHNVCEEFETYDTFSKKARALYDYPLKVAPKVADLKNAPEIIPLPPGSRYILAVSPVEFARQITIMTEEKISLIPHTEILKQEAWSKEGKKAKARSYNAFKMFNIHVTNWILAEILKPPLAEERAKVIGQLIDTATELWKLHNFNGVYSFFTVLGYSTVCRLKTSWEIIKQNKKLVKQMKAIETLFDPSRKSSNYREALNSVPPNTPFIPVIAFKMGEISSLNEVTKDYVAEPKGWINWYKMEVLSRIIRSIKGPRPLYCFKTYPEVQQLIVESEGWDINSDSGCAVAKICKLRESQQSWSQEVTKQDTKRLWDSVGMSMTKNDWKQLASFGHIVEFTKRSTILREGEYNICIFQVQSGTVTEVKTNKEWKVGSIFGWSSIFSDDNDHPADTTVIANEDVKVLELPLPFIMRLYDLYPHIAMKMNYSLCLELCTRLQQMMLQANSPALAHRGSMLRMAPPTDRQTDPSKSRILSNLTKDEMVLHQWKCALRDKKRLVGTFYVTPHYFLFSGKAFGYKKELVLEIRSITVMDLVTVHGESKIAMLTNLTDHKKISVRTIPQAITQEMFKLIHELWTQVKLQPDTYKKLKIKSDSENMTWWDEILEGSSVHTFQKGDIIVKQGDFTNGRLYHISHGRCEDRTTFPDGSSASWELDEGKIFGEVSFLLGEKASSDIIANEDNTTITVIEAYFINILFQHRPGIAGRFYFQLGQVLYRRLHSPVYNQTVFPVIPRIGEKKLKQSTDLKKSNQ